MMIPIEMKKYADGITAFIMWAAVVTLVAAMFIEIGGI